MSFEQILFYVFAAIAVVAGLRVITARNTVHSALFLVLAFVTSAGIWMLAEAEFLALSLILVYVGAVMVLFLFVVMMLDINVTRSREGFARFLPVAAGVGGIMLAELAVILYRNFNPEKFAGVASRHEAGYSNTKALGAVLYTEHVFAFELAAAILLVGIVAAISLTLRRRPGIKTPDVARQVRVTKADRLRVVKMKAEKKL